ncbi:MAG: hypothetical protein ACD_54C00929G0001, partial [uncultured bacterium]
SLERWRARALRAGDIFAKMKVARMKVARMKVAGTYSGLISRWMVWPLSGSWRLMPVG